MAYEIRLEDRQAKVELLNRVGSKAVIKVDDVKYEVDIVMVEAGVYSILFNGRSHNVELVGEGGKKYTANTFSRSFNVEIIDAEAKYQQSRSSGFDADEANHIASPMPGKVVKILVGPGDTVTAGQTVIIVEAMKMQSEYKATGDKVVKDVLVKEGDIVEAHQTLINLGEV
jgi:biotin carboxyl carrier protein